jgi:uncharacterized alkaline shock family protein YloU
MNIFNRLVIILLILVAMVAIPLALILPEQAAYVLRYGADLIDVNLDWLSTLTPTAELGVRILLGAVGLVVFLVGVLFLVLEVIRFRRNTVKLRDGSGELMMDGVSGHLSYYVDLLPDVMNVKPRVQSKGKSVEVSLYVETAPDVSIPDKTAEVKETARKVLEEKLGLRISKEIQVLIKPVSHPQMSRGRRRMWQPKAPVTQPPEIVQEPPEPVSPPEPQESPVEDLLDDYVPEEEALPAAEEQESETIEVKRPEPEE